MRMTGKIRGLIAAGLIMTVCVACSGGSSESQTALTLDGSQAPTATTSTTSSTAGETVVPAGEIPEGMYLSEITGEPISEAIKDQRPIAVMIDNEITALDHAGTAKADVVYEMINSLANNRVTRLMCIYKNWKNIEMIGSIRSVRTTNLILYPEWNAILCHDGGPFYVDSYFANDYTPHFSGYFSRVENGKPYEYTEYIVNDGSVSDLDDNFKRYKCSETYDKYRLDDLTHFNFCNWGEKVDLSTQSGSMNAKLVDLSGAFFHNSSKLEYNEQTGTYDYYEYGRIHKDINTDAVLTFDNVILQEASVTKLDENGYMHYELLTSQMLQGYYITGGKAIKIYWNKPQVLDHTRYYVKNAAGDYEELKINTGKTYIGLIPDDTWNDIVIQ